MLHRNILIVGLLLSLCLLAFGADDRSLSIKPKSGSIERRVALVIGNSSYPDAPLKNPVNDADAMVTALKETGFDVVVRKNADRRAMYSAIKEFSQKLKKSDIGLFYYAGHGVQIDSSNYLLPTDLRNSELQDSDDLRRDAVALSDLLERMRDAGTRNVIILDACRDNPFLAKLSRGGTRGLAKVVTPANTSILYSTDPGNTASDGASGDNGIFTKHLAGTIRRDGLELVDVMREVSISVDRETSGAQRPVFDGVLSAKFYFKPQQEVVAKLVEPSPSIGIDPKAIEFKYWEGAEKANTVSAYKKYLKKYPDGEFADIAIEKLQLLESAESKTREASRNETDQKKSSAEKERLERERLEQERLAKERQEQERRVKELEERFRQAEERARLMEEKAAKSLKAQEAERAAIIAKAEEKARQLEEKAAKALRDQEAERAAIIANAEARASMVEEKSSKSLKAKEDEKAAILAKAEERIRQLEEKAAKAMKVKEEDSAALAALIKREKDREQAELEKKKSEQSAAEKAAAERAEKERLAAEKAKKELELEQAKLKELQKEMQKGTYTDPKTGLVWLRDGNAAGYKMDWASANDWVKKQNFAGYKGWRLPTREELFSLFKKGEKKPSVWLNSNGFKNVQSAEYWTADVNRRQFDLAIYVDLSNGEDGEFKPNFVGFHVWPVLDSKKAVAVVGDEMTFAEISKKIADETAKEIYVDTKAGLMWLRNGNASGMKMEWRQAVNWTKELKAADYEGWRLPTKDELLSLVKSGAKKPSFWLNSNGFNNVKPAEYWTQDSGPNQRILSKYYVDLDNGDISDIDPDRYFFYVLPVLDLKKAVEQFNNRTKVATGAEKIYTDPDTGLMWPQDANIARKSMDRSDAVKWLRGLSYGGFKDWRLPTLDELRRFAAKAGARPFEGLATKGFHNVMESYYWVNDTFPWGSGVSMFNGGIEKQFTGQIRNYVWPVRDGKGNASMLDVVISGGK